MACFRFLKLWLLICLARVGNCAQAPAIAVLAFANKYILLLVQAGYLYRKRTPFQSQSSDCTVNNTFTFMNYTDKEHRIKITK